MQVCLFSCLCWTTIAGHLPIFRQSFFIGGGSPSTQREPSTYGRKNWPSFSTNIKVNHNSLCEGFVLTTSELTAYWWLYMSYIDKSTIEGVYVWKKRKLRGKQRWSILDRETGNIDYICNLYHYKYRLHLPNWHLRRL